MLDTGWSRPRAVRTITPRVHLTDFEAPDTSEPSSFESLRRC